MSDHLSRAADQAAGIKPRKVKPSKTATKAAAEKAHARKATKKEQAAARKAWKNAPINTGANLEVNTDAKEGTDDETDDG
jgi:hypothetical protein